MSVRSWAKTSDTYRIVRVFFNGGSAGGGSRRRVIIRGLSEAQAQEHCADLNTSSSTAWKTSAIKRTKRYGAWFDSYERE